jgi:hypothetical protein
MTHVATRQWALAAVPTLTIGADRSRCTRLVQGCAYRKYRKLQHVEMIGVSASMRASNPIFRKALPATCNGPIWAGEERRRAGVQGPDWRGLGGDTGCSRPPVSTEVASHLPSPSRNIYRKYRKIQLLEIQGVLSAEDAPTRIFRKCLPVDFNARLGGRPRAPDRGARAGRTGACRRPTPTQQPAALPSLCPQVPEIPPRGSLLHSVFLSRNCPLFLCLNFGAQYKGRHAA